MEFLAVITVLIAVQIWGNGGVIQRDTWLDGLYARFSSIADYRVRLAAIILLPVLLVMLIEALLGGVLWGLALLLFYIAVLLYSLGRGDFSLQLKLYFDAWQRGDLEAAYQQAGEMEGFDASAMVDTARGLHDQIRRAIFYQGFERWFAVVFWFVILGPAGALAYRLFKIIAQKPETSDQEQATLDTAIYYAEWLPARVLAFTFALTGNFDRCLSRCRELLFEPTASSDLLDQCGTVAITEPLPDNCEDNEFTDLAVDELKSSQQLLSRSLLCWVAILALVQLI